MNATQAIAVTHLIVCGNADRRDDGAAMRALCHMLPGLVLDRRVAVRRCGQLDIQHLLEVPAGEPVVIADAAVGVPAGEVVTLPLDELIDHPRGPAPHSSHALPIDQVLGVTNVLAEQPLSGLFVGIGGADFGFGDGLSEPVAAALPAFIRAIGRAIEQVAGVPAAAPKGGPDVP